MADRDDYYGGERSSEEIRREIEQTRLQMDDTVDAIGDKLSAARILDEMWVRVRSGDGAAVLGEAVRDHPMPFALMGLGIGWLAVEQARSREERRHGHMGPGTYARAEGRVGPYRSDAVHQGEGEHTGRVSAAKDKAQSAAHKVSDAAHKVSDVASSIKDKASDLKDSVTGASHRARDSASDTRERVAGVAHDAQERATHAGEAVRDRAADVADDTSRLVRQGADRTKAGFMHLLESNPLALGAIAFGVGLASGLGAPTTRWEDEHMGPMSDTVKDQAKRIGQESVEKARHVARDAANAAREEFEHQRDDEGTKEAVAGAIDQVKESAREIARAAKDEAQESAESEDLTGEGIRRQTSYARQQARNKKRASGD